MKNTMKKILCTFLVVVMCLTSAPLQGFVGMEWPSLPEINFGEFELPKLDFGAWFSSKASAATEGYYTYTVTNGKATITDVNTSISGDITIPATLGGYSVTTIGDYAFAYCDSLTSVTIPDSVTTIGERAFYSCNSLTSITIGDSVTTIGYDAFAYCYSLTSVTIPDSVTTIGDWAFVCCRSLTSITIPNSVTTIGSGAFGECYNLTNATIGDSVATIGEGAFFDCHSLTNVTIPASVTSIEESVWYGCNNLKSITVDSNNTKYSSDSRGVLFNKDKSILLQYPAGNISDVYIIPDSVVTVFGFAFCSCTNLVSVEIGNNVTDIENAAFARCNNLKSITIPDSVTIIGTAAFVDCYNLSNVTLGNSVENIGESAFSGCSNLINITIPDSVTTIDMDAFLSCDSLTSITIPDSVTTIGDRAFYYCDSLTDVYYNGTEEQWKKITIGSLNDCLTGATIHYNYKPTPTSYFMVSSDTYSVDSINRKETATYKIHLLDENSDFLPVDNVTVQNNTTDIVNISTNKVSETELELTVEPIKDGEASISLFNGDGSVEQFFNFTVYSNTTTYRADQVPVTNEKLKTNFSRGDLTVDNFEYKFDENKGKYIATMDVYNSSGAIGVVAAYTQDGKISDIEQVDPYVPLPGDFGEFLVYLGAGAVGILKGENWNYRFAGDSQKTSIEIEVPEDGYLTVSCDVTADNAAFIYNLVSIGVDFAFKTAEVIDVLGTDTDKLAKDTTKTLAKKVSEYFNEDSEWTAGAIKKLAKTLSKQFNMAYLEEISVLSLEMLDEMYKNVGEDFSDAVLDVIIDLTKEEIKEFGVMAAAKKLVKDKVIGTAEKTLLKAASIMFDGGSYINLLNSILGAYRYNVGTGKTMVVFKPKGEDGFICKDTIKVKSDIITDEVLLHTYVIKDTQKEDAFVRKTIYSDFNRGDGLRKEELSIDLNRIVEIHEISLWKNGQEVFDTFTATVEMNLPSYIDRRTCSIYRVEKDGTYTKLDTKIEGNKIIFETDHFSEYILTGVVEDLQETTPCDVHIYEEVRTEPSCTEEGSITYTCYCGDTYTKTIEPTGHTFEDGASKCSNCDFDKSDDCSCSCHKGGISGFFFKLILFFQKIFKTNKTCSCGVNHY